jgi:hypothetical protein
MDICENCPMSDEECRDHVDRMRLPCCRACTHWEKP